MKLFQILSIAALAALSGCSAGSGVVHLQNNADSAATVEVTLSRDFAGAQPIAKLRFTDVGIGASAEQPYTVDREYYMSILATLKDGRVLRSHYGYVIDEEWEAMRQSIVITPTSIIVNGEVAPSTAAQ